MTHGLSRFGSGRGGNSNSNKNNSNYGGDSSRNHSRDDQEEGPSLMNLPPSLSQQTPIYRTPFYVEEASLYSIAEDSREDRASEITSRAGTVSTTSTPVSVKHEHLSLSSSPVSGPVLTDWSMDMDDENWGLNDDDDDLDDDGFDNDLVNAAKRSRWAPATAPNQTDGDEESSNPSDDGTYPMSLDNHHQDPIPGKRRRTTFLIYSSLIAVVLASIVISISIALLNKGDPTPRTNTSDGLSSTGEVSFEAGNSPTQAPTTQPSSQPTPAPFQQQGQRTPSRSPTSTPSRVPTSQPTHQPSSAPFPQQVDTKEERQVYSALSACETADLDEALDSDTIQHQVYRQLVFEARDNSAMGPEELLERWALIMLFVNTYGEFWYDSHHWFLVDQDVCDWSEGRIICDPRVNGGAAVTGLFLRDNNMHGEIPKELCCLPKLEKLDLSNNHLTYFPPCLDSMNLGILNKSGNPGS